MVITKLVNPTWYQVSQKIRIKEPLVEALVEGGGSLGDKRNEEGKKRDIEQAEDVGGSKKRKRVDNDKEARTR